MASHLFLISYIRDNQPCTCELRTDAEDISVEGARRYLQEWYGGDAASFTDVQVQRIDHEHEPGTSPAHNQRS